MTVQQVYCIFLYEISHSSIDLMIGRMDSPSSLNAYSTRGGTSGYTVLVTIPSSSIERRLSVKTFWLIPSKFFFKGSLRFFSYNRVRKKVMTVIFERGH